MRIYPAILSGDIQQVQQQLDLCTQFNNCEVVHLDLIDGYYTDNLTVTPADLAGCEFGSLHCDLHLMAVDPEDMVNEVVEFASLLPVRSIIAQVEKMGSERSYVEAVRREGWQVGLSLDVGTALESIDETVWSHLQQVQVMGVPAGEQGQAFAERTLQLVDEIVALRRKEGLTFELLVDGGVRPALLATLTARHVDGCTAGSFLWDSDDPVDRWYEIAG